MAAPPRRRPQASLLICAAAPLARRERASRALQETTAPATAPQVWNRDACSAPTARPRPEPSSSRAPASRARGDDGSFALALELPTDAQAVEVIATLAERSGSGALVARERLVPSPARGSERVARHPAAPDVRPSRRRTGRATFGGKSVRRIARRAPWSCTTTAAVPALYVGGSFGDIGGIDAAAGRALGR
jgi:hypothetical protein